jgi:hypothetical protein
VARLRIADGNLVVRLNPIEVVMALRTNVTVPLSAVRSVAVENHPLTSGSVLNVRLGFAASGAPLSLIATVGPRANYRDGRAFVVVWRNARSVVVELATNQTPWRLLVVSTKAANEVAQRLQTATGV